MKKVILYIGMCMLGNTIHGMSGQEHIRKELRTQIIQKIQELESTNHNKMRIAQDLQILAQQFEAIPGKTAIGKKLLAHAYEHIKSTGIHIQEPGQDTLTKEDIVIVTSIGAVLASTGYAIWNWWKKEPKNTKTEEK